jgi:hypothetical protein
MTEEKHVMSEGKFWGRSQSQRKGYRAGAGTPADDWMLTAKDCCDRCGARAYVRVLLPSRLELLFCAHHNKQYASALAEIAVEIHDETGRLTRAAA